VLPLQSQMTVFLSSFVFIGVEIAMSARCATLKGRVGSFVLARNSLFFHGIIPRNAREQDCLPATGKALTTRKRTVQSTYLAQVGRAPLETPQDVREVTRSDEYRPCHLVCFFQSR
jgi:hypothetical protein